ncbi:MAG: immunoglobulin-like domain-containing protein [Patescibacteria group bacterium]
MTTEQQSQQPTQEKIESKPPAKTNWKYLAIVAVVAILALGGILLFKILGTPGGGLPLSNECRQLEQEIGTLIKQANYCEVDEDCGWRGIGFPLCQCGFLMNEEADLTRAETKVSEWRKQCIDSIDSQVNCETCEIRKRQPVCQDSQCVEVFTVQVLKKSATNLHHRKVVVEGVYRWGFEDSNFDETADSEEDNIWVEVNEETKLENKHMNFHKAAFGGVTLDAKHEGTANVTIYGIFHAYDPTISVDRIRGDPPVRGNFGHLGLWKHQIVADKIVFETGISNGVIVTTDKTEYVRGESVMITLENRAEITKQTAPYYSIERFSNNHWIQVPYVTCPCNALCNAPPGILESGEQRQSMWNQEEGFCNNFKEVSNQAVPGRYRIMITVNNVGDTQENWETVYSKEFVIK